MKIKFFNRGNTLIVSLDGELDHHSCEYVKRKLDCEIVKVSTKNLIFDMTNLSFMDSSGIGVLVGRLKQVQKLNGKTALVSLNKSVKKLLHLSGILGLVDEYQNIDEAIKTM